MNKIKKARKAITQKRLETLQNKYRLIMYNDESFEEIISFRLTKMNVFILFGFISIILMLLVYFLIAYTPLKEYVIPDYPKLEERQSIIENRIKADSLENQLRMYIQKNEILATIINGGEPPQLVDEINDTSNLYNDLELNPSMEDSLMRIEMAEYEALNVNFQPGIHTNSEYSNLFFYAPIQGTISNKYARNHFATDIVAVKNSIIHSVLSGTVIIDTWTVETGYILIIQHSNDYVSVYKHCSKLLKKTGDHVEAGEGISIIGNTGELSTGPHLHFELWHEGKPVNAEEFIAF